MNAPQIHLMLNHLPVIGAVFATIALAVGLFWRTAALQRFALGTIVLVALAAVPVYLSGEPAEEVIEHAAGVERTVVQSHEQMAKVAMVAVQAIGLVTLIALWRHRRRAVPVPFATILLIVMFALCGALAWTAHLGGQIRHPELRGDSVATVEHGD